MDLVSGRLIEPGIAWHYLVFICDWRISIACLYCFRDLISDLSYLFLRTILVLADHGEKKRVVLDTANIITSTWRMLPMPGM